MTDPKSIALHQRVRVKAGCPLTLPHYARGDGIVEELTDDEAVVRFGEDRYFPIPKQWLVVAEP